MRVLLLGSGASIHALVWKLVSSPWVEEIHCAPGNAGTALLAGGLPVPLEHSVEVAQWAFSRQVDLVVVQGMPEWTEVLAGVGLPVLGVGQQEWAALSSRQGVRERLRSHGLFCPEGRTFQDLDAAERYLASRRLPLWIQPDDAGQWEAVRVEERLEAFRELSRCLSLAPGAQVSIEEDAVGAKVGLALLTDGQRAISLGVSRFYGHRYEGQTGPMTEGMGAYAPFGDQALEERLMETVGRPVVAAMASEGLLRPAFLHLPIVLGEAGPMLRGLSWGLDDLHAAVILPRWGGNLAEVLEAAARGTLEEGFPPWQRGVAVAVAAVMESYPGPCPEGYPVRGLYDTDLLVFHHATRLQADLEPIPRGPLPWLRPPPRPHRVGLTRRVVTAGGRVLLVVGYALTGAEARRQAYEGVERVEFPQRAWRRDIAAELG